MRAVKSFRPPLKFIALLIFSPCAMPLAYGVKTNSPAVAHVPREVLAFYYPWYGPSRHWGKVDAVRHEIQASMDYPLKGAYDSHDSATIAWQINVAKTHGITGFIVSWWGQGSYEDQAVPLVLQCAEQKHFKVTIYWEKAPGEGPPQTNHAVDDLTYVLTHYGTNSAFLKVDGKPVIFVYGRVMRQVPFVSWPEIVHRVCAKAGDFLLIADGCSERNARLFDGLHTYNICGSIKGKTPAALQVWAKAHYSNAVKLGHEYNRIACVTVIPGYDDTKIRSPGLKVDRQNGKVYSVLWQEAIKAKPDWVLITSWNEWHEGSEIEPSLEYGNQYLQMTTHYATCFRQGGKK